MFRQFITDPDAFITERVTTRSARIEVVVVLLIGTLGSLGMLHLGLEILDVTDSQDMPLAVAAYVLRPLFATIGLWIGFSILFHFATRVFNARGRLRRLFTGFAWAMVPMGLGNLVQSAAIYVVLMGLEVDEYLVGEAPGDRIDAVIEALMADPIMIVASIVFLATVAWTAYLMTFVLENVKTNLSYDQAVKLVVPIFGIQILFGAWAIFNGTRSFALLL